MAEHQIASPSRDKNGTITTPGARFVGDLESVIETTANQIFLHAQSAKRSITAEVARQLAKSEVTGIAATEEVTDAKS